MKKLLKGLFKSRKKNNPSSTQNAMELGEVFSFMENKMFPCSECGHFIQLDKPKPLTMAACSKCGSSNFIPKKLGPFWLYKFCAQGGQGRVYKATCSLVPNMEFAIKILPEEFNNEADKVALLQREAEITALFNDHPNSVNVVEFDTDDDIFYMATEFIDGLLLNVLVEQKGKLSEYEAVSYALAILDIDETIFSKGYLYRDLKPQNIVIGDDNNLVLLDYGLCLPKGIAAHHTSREIDGSPHFVPPERMTGEGEDLTSEIYSIGMLLYYMLTGKTYFKGKSLQEIAEQHVHGKRIANLASEMPLVDEELVKLIERMVHPRKRKRVQSFKEVRSVLHYIWKKYQTNKK